MAYTITVNGVDYTGRLKSKTLQCTRKNDYSNEFIAEFMMNSADTTRFTDFQEGVEVIFTIDSTTKFGGIVQSAEFSYIGKNTAPKCRLKARNYGALLARRTLGGTITDKYCGDEVERIVDEFLSDTAVDPTYSEHFTKGIIYKGSYIENIAINGNSIKWHWDKYAKASGYKYWITDDKEVYFAPFSEIETAEWTDPGATTKEIYLKESGVISFPTYDYSDWYNPKIKGNIANYSNKYFVNADQRNDELIIGQYEDSAEITRMSALYGSGVYGKAITENSITTQSDADKVAENFVKQWNRVPTTLEFITYEDNVDINTKFKAYLESIGIDADTQFVCTKVLIYDDGCNLRYKVTSELYTDVTYPTDDVVYGTPSVTASQLKFTNDWVEVLGSLKTENVDTYEKTALFTEIEGDVYSTVATDYTETITMVRVENLDVSFNVPVTDTVANGITASLYLGTTLIKSAYYPMVANKSTNVSMLHTFKDLALGIYSVKVSVVSDS